MRATLDGITEDSKTIVEIKLLTTVNPQKPNYETAGYKKFEATQQGFVPTEYLAQVQHQLMLTGAKKCLFVGYKEIKGDYVMSQDKLAIVEVVKLDGYIERLAELECKFWLQVVKERDKLRYENELE